MIGNNGSWYLSRTQMCITVRMELEGYKERVAHRKCIRSLPGWNRPRIKYAGSGRVSMGAQSTWCRRDSRMRITVRFGNQSTLGVGGLRVFGTLTVSFFPGTL
jgi:hypothetical protein